MATIKVTGAVVKQSVNAINAIEVSNAVAAPLVVRGGKEIVAPSVNVQRVADLLGQAPTVGRIAIARVVSQSIPPGNRVPKGTPVDLVLMPAGQIPIGIVDNVHRDLANKSIQDVYSTLTNSAVVNIVDKYESADTVSAADKAAFTTAVANIMTINDQSSDTSFATAFQSMKSLQAFG